MIDKSLKISRGVILGLGLLGLVASGCADTSIGGDERYRPVAGATLSGKITVDGRPLSYGVILLVGPERPTPIAWGPIAVDGSYRIENIPAGNVQLLISDESGDKSARLRPNLKPKQAESSKKESRVISSTWELSPEQRETLKKVVERYGSFSSPEQLGTTIAPGDNHFDPALTIR